MNQRTPNDGSMTSTPSEDYDSDDDRDQALPRQADPLRTSVDGMAGRGRSGGARRAGGFANRSGSGGNYGPRGPGNRERSFNR